VNEWFRTWGLRLLALGIALGIWFNASVEDRLVFSDKVVEAGIAYNRPRGFVITTPAQNVNVRLTGSKKAIRRLSPYMVQVQVELSQRQEGLATISLGPDNVLVPEGLEVASIEPNTIQVDLEREVTQRIQVVPQLMGRPAAGTAAGEPEVFPNQVLVTGPAPLLARTESISTQPIRLDGHATPFEELVTVLPPDPLIQVIQPLKVTVKVPIKPAVEQPATPKPRKGKGKKT
jgi:YbbR domain-containing protein